jgi:hypothetical protein
MTQGPLVPPTAQADDAPKPAYSYMERIAALEHDLGVANARLKIVQTALSRAFGPAWMEQVQDEAARDESAG